MVSDDVDPSMIRKPRYRWTSNMPQHPKVLEDTCTGASCYFSPSLNIIRALGPDFDFNPLNGENSLSEVIPLLNPRVQNIDYRVDVLGKVLNVTRSTAGSSDSFPN